VGRCPNVRPVFAFLFLALAVSYGILYFQDGSRVVFSRSFYVEPEAYTAPEILLCPVVANNASVQLLSAMIYPTLTNAIYRVGHLATMRSEVAVLTSDPSLLCISLTWPTSLKLDVSYTAYISGSVPVEDYELLFIGLRYPVDSSSELTSNFASSHDASLISYELRSAVVNHGPPTTFYKTSITNIRLKGPSSPGDFQILVKPASLSVNKFVKHWDPFLYTQGLGSMIGAFEALFGLLSFVLLSLFLFLQCCVKSAVRSQRKVPIKSGDMQGPGKAPPGASREAVFGYNADTGAYERLAPTDRPSTMYSRDARPPTASQPILAPSTVVDNRRMPSRGPAGTLKI